MLGIQGTYTELHGGFRGYVAKIQAATAEAPDDAAEFMADEWRRHVRVDTGSLRDGIYTQTHDHSGYGEAVARAQADNPHVELHAELPKPARKGAAAVGSAAGHDIHNEYGTSTMPARPAFVPAVAATKRQFPEITRRKLAL